MDQSSNFVLNTRNCEKKFKNETSCLKTAEKVFNNETTNFSVTEKKT